MQYLLTQAELDELKTRGAEEHVQKRNEFLRLVGERLQKMPSEFDSGCRGDKLVSLNRVIEIVIAARKESGF